jgi:hypothetical protein
LKACAGRVVEALVIEKVENIGDMAFELKAAGVTVGAGIVAGLILAESSFLAPSAAVHVTFKMSKLGSERKYCTKVFPAGGSGAGVLNEIVALELVFRVMVIGTLGAKLVVSLVVRLMT